ncbi:PAS domain S-box protein [Bradyrhizobium sp. HKCCYLRH3095]|uniref:PAS domain S-box protein n=1 Tax=Bradyrhizobium sp. HKCCYLRH3095 TaxID=3420765 RepID=UPI003EB7FC5B
MVDLIKASDAVPSDGAETSSDRMIQRMRALLRARAGRDALDRKRSAVIQRLLRRTQQLEASRKELQIANKTLNTHNFELKSRLEALARYQSDLDNLIAATGDATLFLDPLLHIKQATPKVRQYFNISDGYEGCLLTDLTSRLKYPDLAADARGVLTHSIPIEREVEGDDSNWSLVRIRPYLTSDHRIDGIVITISDVTPAHNALQALNQTESRYRALVTSTSDATYRMSPDWAEMRHLDGGGFLQDAPGPMADWLDIYIPKADQPAVQAAIHAATQTTGAFQLEHRVKRADGHLGWMFSRAIPVLDQSGHVIEWFGAGTDITSRKDMEMRAADSDARYRAIVECAPLAIVIIDDKGIIQSANATTASMFGYDLSEMIGQNVSMLMPSDHAARHDSYLQNYKISGKRRISQDGRAVTGRHKDGSTVELHLAVAEWVSKCGDRFFGGLITDLTEGKRVERELSDARSMAAIGQLSGLIAHDSNNLLAIISGNLELLDQQISDDRLRRLIRSAMRASESSALFNRRLLSMSRRQGSQLAALRVNDRLRDLALLLQGSLGPQISLTLDLAQDVWTSIADVGEIDSAVLNLVTNSRDALPKGGSIVIRTRNMTIEDTSHTTPQEAPTGDFVCVSIIDDGIGMRKDVLERATEPFFTTKRAGKGIGLGLHGVKTFAQSAGGFFSIESRENDGTTASFYLPRTMEPPIAPDPEDGVLPFGDGQLILVVEDEDQLREITLQRIEALGYAVEGARSIAEAIDLLKSGLKVDLIFSDVLMPGDKGGVDLARWAEAERPGLKIIFTTGFAGDSSGEAAYARWTVLHKPYSRSQLATALRGAFEDRGSVVDT